MSTATLLGQSTQDGHSQELTDFQKLSGFHEPIEQTEVEEQKTGPKQLQTVPAKLRTEGIRLNEAEAAILHAAQVGEKGFATGRKVRVRLVKRIARNFLEEELGEHQVSAVIKNMIDRGIIKQHDNHMCLVRHFGGNSPFSAELETTPEPAYSLSNELRKAGHQLSEVEALLLDVAQVVHKGFKRGIATSLRVVKRVLNEYHGDVCKEHDLTRIASRLTTRGILQKTTNTIRLKVHFGPERKEPKLSALQRLVDDEQHRAFLKACDDCCGIGWSTARNVSAREAVKSLVMARYGISHNVFKERIRALKSLGILEEVDSKGTTAFRLTVHATERLNRLRQKPIQTPLDVLPEPIRKPAGSSDDELTPLADVLVATATADGDVDQIEMSYLWESFQKQGHTFQEFRRAIGELVACERARLLEANSGGQTVCHLELTGTDRNVPISFAMRSLAPSC